MGGGYIYNLDVNASTSFNFDLQRFASSEVQSYVINWGGTEKCRCRCCNNTYLFFCLTLLQNFVYDVPVPEPTSPDIPGLTESAE